MTPPAIEVHVGSNYKSDPSFYAPLDFKEKNGVDVLSLKEGIKYEHSWAF